MAVYFHGDSTTNRWAGVEQQAADALFGLLQRGEDSIVEDVTSEWAREQTDGSQPDGKDGEVEHQDRPWSAALRGSIGAGMQPGIERAAGLIQEAAELCDHVSAAGHHAARATAGVEARYSSHVQRQAREVGRVTRAGRLPLPQWVTSAWLAVPGIPRADAEALQSAGVTSVAEAGRVPGVRPSTVSLLAALASGAAARPRQSEGGVAKGGASALHGGARTEGVDRQGTTCLKEGARKAVVAAAGSGSGSGAPPGETARISARQRRRLKAAQNESS